MSTYTIEDGVPMTMRKGRPASEERQTMRALQVGQSFLIPDAERAQHARWTATRMPGMKFSVLKSREGWRVWRTA
jgi:hypothetical protein